MTPVNSAAKMVGHLRRWLTGDEVTADGSCSAENVSGRCGTCTCNLVGGVPLQYRGRSYSDCCAVPCRGGHLDAESRDRSCSVSGRRMSLSRGWRRLGLNTYHTSSGSVWSSDRSSDVQAVLEEDHELCRCCEPVCCCERCFVYVDDRLPLLPPPYSELTVEHCTDVAAKVIDKPSVTVNTADVTVDADDNHPSLSADICPSAAARLDDMSKQLEVSSGRHAMTSSLSHHLPPSVHVSFDGEEGYANSQRRLRWARRQRLTDDALATTACPPPNRTICHVVDCW